MFAGPVGPNPCGAVCLIYCTARTVSHLTERRRCGGWPIMLKLEGDGSTRTCDGVTRRDFIEVGALGALGFTLSHLFNLKAQGAVAKDKDDRACILIFNLGAPSQIDLFDPKPDAPEEIRGPFKTIKTASPDIQLTELLPLHAKHADKFSLVRSVYHTAAAVHATGPQMMHTGRPFTGSGNT